MPSDASLNTTLQTHYDMAATSIERTTPGLDVHATAFKVVTHSNHYFMKVRTGPLNVAAHHVPRLLADAGIPNLVPPIPTVEGALWAQHEDRSLTLFPFIDGDLAANRGLTESQWAELGQTLRAIHDFTSGSPAIANRSTTAWGRGSEHNQVKPEPNQMIEIRQERLALPSAHVVLEVLANPPTPNSGSQRRLLQLLETHRPKIQELINQAEGLKPRLHLGEQVVCHADLHLWNILVSDHGVHIIDWEDGPLLAPRERDLIFLIEGRAPFLKGYGHYDIDRNLLTYFQLERQIEDIAADIQIILNNKEIAEEDKMRLLPSLDKALS